MPYDAKHGYRPKTHRRSVFGGGYRAWDLKKETKIRDEEGTSRPETKLLRKADVTGCHCLLTTGGPIEIGRPLFFPWSPSQDLKDPDCHRGWVFRRLGFWDGLLVLLTSVHATSKEFDA